MPKQSAERLLLLCEKIPRLLGELKTEEFETIPGSGTWSKKQILGHLIDSATNNHQRFVRLQFESEPRIVYDQDQWNAHSYHQQMPGKDLIQFWESYNRYLALLLLRVPERYHHAMCELTNGNKQPFSFIAQDYVQHQEHHLQQIVKYDF